MPPGSSPPRCHHSLAQQARFPHFHARPWELAPRGILRKSFNSASPATKTAGRERTSGRRTIRRAARALQFSLPLRRLLDRPRRGPIGGLAAAGSHNGHCTFALGQVHQADYFFATALPTEGNYQGFDPLGWQHASTMRCSPCLAL
jgi:hypothetical protein